jgi:acyl-CoA synthetase (AMP-forming)/AMP-acid ligase II
MARALPEGALLHTPYGATEALPVASLDHRTIIGETAAKAAAGAGICVGRPVEGAEVRCIRVDDGPIPAWSPDLEVPRGAPGEICVRGPQVTGSYFARPDADALAKIPDPAGGFWHRMGDVGYLDEAGRLWFCGRKSQRVRTAEGDLYADQWEAVVNAHPQVERSALVGVGDPGRQDPYFWVQLACDADYGLWTGPAAGILAEVWPPPGPGRGPGAKFPGMRERMVGFARSNPGLFLPLAGEPLPVDARHNAKIRREILAERAARRPRGDL